MGDTIDAATAYIEVLNKGITPTGKRRLKVLKYAVDWSPRSFRVFEPIRVVYPLHVVDDLSVDNFTGYTERAAADGLHGLSLIHL